MITCRWALFVGVALIAGIAAGDARQRGFFGPVTSTPRAGDPAPDLSFDKVLSAPENRTGIPPRLVGQMTVLAFMPNISSNPQLVAAANAVVDQFVGKPVQFIWITGEKEVSLVPSLAEHPLRGFVLLDSKGVTGRSYGLEMPATVFIGADGRIIGFDPSFRPMAESVKAVLEGRATTTAPSGPEEFKALANGHKVLLQAQGPRFPRPDENKPDFAPSYAVHISPSNGSEGRSSSGSDSWETRQGFDLRSMLAELYDIGPIRIELPASLDDGKRYDVSLVLPQAESREKMTARLQQGIQDYFFLAATRQPRLMKVYVVTAPGERKPTPVSPELGGFANISSTSIGVEFSQGAPDLARLPRKLPTAGLSALDSIGFEGSMEELCRTLERTLDRPVVDETSLKGRFKLAVGRDPSAKEDSSPKDDFLTRLREATGLVIEPAERNVEMLVFNPR